MTHRPVPPLLREQLRLGELPDDVAADVAARLAGSPTAERSDAEILAAAPPATFMAEVRRRGRVAEEPSRAAPVFRCSIVLAVAASAMLFAVPRSDTPIGECLDVRTKGDAMLSVTAVGQSTPLANDATVHAGDDLQLALSAPCAGWAVVFSVDAMGTVTEHQRFEGVDSLAGPVPLARGFKLDDSPGYEAFHLVSSPTPIDIDAILDHARAQGPSEASPLVEAAVHTIVLRKDTP